VAGLALPLLFVTIAGVLVRPRGASEWIVAVLGASTMLAVGAIGAAEAAGAVAAQWDVFLFFLGLMVIAAIADQSGVVVRLTLAAQRLARGRRDFLFVLVCAVAVVITTTLSNDATVLVLTPLVLGMAARLGVPPLPFAFACAYLANASSLTLPVANPANIIVLHGAPLTLSTYLDWLALPSLGAILATVVVLYLMFRRELSGRLAHPAPEITDGDATSVAIGIGLVVVGYLVALETGWPVGVVAVVGGAALTLLLLARRRLDPRKWVGGIAWEVFPLLAGLIVVVSAASESGLGEWIATALRELVALGAVGVVASGIASALAANAMNNLPLALLVGNGLAELESGPAAVALVAALLVGIDLGPNFTTVGSLATLLWLLVLRRRGITIGAGEYLRRSWLPSLAALAVALGLLALRSL